MNEKEEEEEEEEDMQFSPHSLPMQVPRVLTSCACNKKKSSENGMLNGQASVAAGWIDFRL